MFRRLAPPVLAVLTALFIWAALRPPPEVTIVVAARNLSAGHTLTAADLTLVSVSHTSAPTSALTQTMAALGQTLAVPRTAGDPIALTHFGAPLPLLAANERALAVQVSDATGLAGLLQPGQRVGVAAVLLDRLGNDTFAKATIGGLRVLYVPPTFRAAVETDLQKENGPLVSASSTATQPRRESGVVVLAVPIEAQAITYRPVTETLSTELEPWVWWVSPLELLAALNASPDAVLSLYLEPEQPKPLITTGLNLALLLLTPTEPNNFGGVK